MGYLVLYATISAGTPTASPTWSDALALLRETVGTLVPGLLGGPWAVEDGAETLMRPPEHPGPWLVAQAAVLVLALLLTAGPRRLARAWTVPLALLGLDVLVVLLTRVDFIGALIGRDPRYFVDVVPLAGIALAVTFLPVVGVEPARAGPGAPRWSGWPRPVRRLALVATVGFVVNSSWITTTAIAVGHRDDPGRPWFEQIQREAAALPPGVGVRDAPTPPTVVSALFGDRARLSQVLGSLPEWEGRIGTTTNDLRDATATGELDRRAGRTARVVAAGAGGRLRIPRGRQARDDPPRGTDRPRLVRPAGVPARPGPPRRGSTRVASRSRCSSPMVWAWCTCSPPARWTTCRISGVDEDLPVCVVRVAAAPPLEP